MRQKKDNDTEKLRKKLKDDCLAMAFGAGFPEALLEIGDIDRAGDEEIKRLAKKRGIR